MVFGLPNEIFIFTLLSTFGFIWFLINRVVKARPTKVLYEEKTGDATVYKGLWLTKENSVKFQTSKYNKIEVKKAANPKMIFFPPLRTEKWFRVKEGENETAPWDFDSSDTHKDFQLGYEAKALTSSLVDSIRSKAALSIKNQMMGIIAGLGFGLAGGIVLGVLIL